MNIGKFLTIIVETISGETAAGRAEKAQERNRDIDRWLSDAASRDAAKQEKQREKEPVRK
jgi:hypothetical protein